MGRKEWRVQGLDYNKERFQVVENLQSARCSPFVISKVLAARMRKLTTARARKTKQTARMLANARKDHSIPLLIVLIIRLNTCFTIGHFQMMASTKKIH